MAPRTEQFLLRNLGSWPGRGGREMELGKTKCTSSNYTTTGIALLVVTSSSTGSGKSPLSWRRSRASRSPAQREASSRGVAQAASRTPIREGGELHVRAHHSAGASGGRDCD